MKPATKAKLIAVVGGWIVKLLCSTLRFRIDDPKAQRHQDETHEPRADGREDFRFLFRSHSTFSCQRKAPGMGISS